VGVAMGCGTGKSTKLMVQVCEHRIARRVFVIQTSHSPARGLAEYVAKMVPDLSVVNVLKPGVELPRRALIFSVPA